MAVAGAQNAAGTAAVAGSAATTASTAAVTGIVATVAGSSIGVQAAVAVGTAAAVTAAVSGGMALYPASNTTIATTTGNTVLNETLLPSMWNGTNTSVLNLSPLTLPQVCDASIAEFKEGRIRVVLEGIQTEAFVDLHKEELEGIFVTTYNEVSNQCEGTYQRIGQSARLIEWSLIDALDTGFLSSTFKVLLSCSGCSDIEPLFFDGEPCLSDNQEQCRQERQLQERSEGTLKEFSFKLEDRVNERYAGTEGIAQLVVKSILTESPDGTPVEEFVKDAMASTEGARTPETQGTDSSATESPETEYSCCVDVLAEWEELVGDVACPDTGCCLICAESFNFPASSGTTKPETLATLFPITALPTEAFSCCADLGRLNAGNLIGQIICLDLTDGCCLVCDDEMIVERGDSRATFTPTAKASATQAFITSPVPIAPTEAPMTLPLETISPATSWSCCTFIRPEFKGLEGEVVCDKENEDNEEEKCCEVCSTSAPALNPAFGPTAGQSSIPVAVSPATIGPTVAIGLLDPTTRDPTSRQTSRPTVRPTSRPTRGPTSITSIPTTEPAIVESGRPNASPITASPTIGPNSEPTSALTSGPTSQPTASGENPGASPAELVPSAAPVKGFGGSSTAIPQSSSTSPNTAVPTLASAPGPTEGPTSSPTPGPTGSPTIDSSTVASGHPSIFPSSGAPSAGPTSSSSSKPTLSLTTAPTSGPTVAPTRSATASPAEPIPTVAPTKGLDDYLPGTIPSSSTSPSTSTFGPTEGPTSISTPGPTGSPTIDSSTDASGHPSIFPSSGAPSAGPTSGSSSTFWPTTGPTSGPTTGPSSSSTELCSGRVTVGGDTRVCGISQYTIADSISEFFFGGSPLTTLEVDNAFVDGDIGGAPINSDRVTVAVVSAPDGAHILFIYDNPSDGTSGRSIVSLDTTDPTLRNAALLGKLVFGDEFNTYGNPDYTVTNIWG